MKSLSREYNITRTLIITFNRYDIEFSFRDGENILFIVTAKNMKSKYFCEVLTVYNGTLINCGTDTIRLNNVSTGLT